MKPKIVFFGTGPVSLACLEGIKDAFTIEAIITKPDRHSPTGMRHEHPVRTWAENHAVAVHQVPDTKSLSSLFIPERFTSSTGLVVDFGMIIPQAVIRKFTKGIINSHFSLLPKLRGADPISFAILEGHEKTGVSLMKIVAALDEGDLITQEIHPLSARATAPELTATLSEISNRLLIELLPKYIEVEMKLRAQVGEPSYTRKLNKGDGIINPSKPAYQLEREVRAFLGWPGSRTTLRRREVIVTAAHVADSEEDAPLTITCTDGSVLAIDRLKPAGKREMSADEFLRGLR